MDDFNSETDSDYTSYWRDWVRTGFPRSSSDVGKGAFRQIPVAFNHPPV